MLQFNTLLIGGIPEGPHVHSVNGRFSGTISYLAVYNTALTYGEIAQLNSTTTSKYTLERYCREYVKEEGLCYLGDSSDYRYVATTIMSCQKYYQVLVPNVCLLL